jgi:hypothetical protein
MKRQLIQFTTVCGLLSLPIAFAQAAATTNYLQLSYNLTHNTNLSPKAVEMAFAGYEWAIKTQKVQNKDILTIVDFSVSSAQKRLYVINIKSGIILMSLPVSHGKGSGANSPWAKSFSNKNNSLQSSLGVFITESTYVGKHGPSLRLKGLEFSNNNAFARNVVVHSANYATEDFIRKYGRTGNSWGCFAVDPKQSKQLINYISGGSVLYAYGKSEQYMAATKILSSQSTA